MIKLIVAALLTCIGISILLLGAHWAGLGTIPLLISIYLLWSSCEIKNERD